MNSVTNHISSSFFLSLVILPTDSTRTAVCCLSSLNLEYYDEWKDNDLFIKDVMEMLDNALTIFIERHLQLYLVR